MIDLHLHILPGVDDGAFDLAQAVAMARHAAGDGCEALIATPHQRRDEWETSDPRFLSDALEALAGRLDGAPRVALGAEVRVDSDLLADLGRPGRAGIQSLAGSRYLLLELDPFGLGPEPVELMRELRAEGWIPVVAHPEVTPFLWNDGGTLPERLVEAGALLQITAASVTGEFGKGPRQRAWQLLDAELVHFVASDAHRPDWRPPGLDRARRAIAKELGESMAKALTLDNPRAVLEDQALPELERPRAEAGR